MLANFKKRYGSFKYDSFNNKVVRGEKKRQVGVHRSLIVAHALDPRFKELPAVKPEQRERVWKYILDLLVERMWQRQEEENRAVEEQLQKAAQSAAPTAAATAAAAPSTPSQGAEEEEEGGAPGNVEQPGGGDFFAIAHRREEATPMSPDDITEAKEQIVSTMKLELNRYKKAKGLTVEWKELKNHDPLKWWKINHHKFPHLWELAEEYLAIPATSAPSERAFSSSGNILTQKRCRLGARLVDDGVILKENQAVIDGILVRMYGESFLCKPREKDEQQEEEEVIEID